jgi:hypothetical protein
MTLTELAANAFNAASIFLAGRNSIHMWWTTIVGCVLFAYVFFHARLYADVTLQMFFNRRRWLVAVAARPPRRRASGASQSCWTDRCVSGGGNSSDAWLRLAATSLH